MSTKISKKHLLVIVACSIFGVLLITFALTQFVDFPMTCRNAVEKEKAEEIWSQNQVAVQTISSDIVGGPHQVLLEAEKCPGKAFLVVPYANAQNREKYTNIINSSGLRELPIEWRLF